MNIDLATALAIGIGTIGPGIGIGLIGGAALLGMARNPQNSDKIQLAAIIFIAFAEAVAIYALLVSLILKFIK